MRYGTPYFKDLKSAINYYNDYHYSNTKETVKRKIAEGEIYIGIPKLKEGEKLLINKKEGRFIIQTKEIIL